MPAVRWSLIVPANGIASPDLRPYDRFGGRGGAMKVRSSVAVAGAGAVSETIFVGSELVEQNGIVGVERAVGAGPDNFTPAIGGVGGPGDPINITYRAVAGPFTVTGFMDIENA
jgi:hypothetical protein